MKIVRILTWLVMFTAVAGARTSAANEDARPWSERAANATIARWPNGRFVPADAHWAWNYELGTLLEGMDTVWLNSADPRYFNYIKSAVDQFVAPDGSISTLKPEENQLDNILLGRQLMLLYGVTQDARYAKAATQLYQQLLQQPRTASGGFWHKQRYPNQMWLDGLYMAEPFYAEYAATFHHPEAFDDITHQFVLLSQHARDAKTGLLYHGWDESKQERWADKQTGLSSQFWARAMGWQMMALVDTLAYYPGDNSGRKELIDQLQQEAAAIVRYQDGATGLWYQVFAKSGAPTDRSSSPGWKGGSGSRPYSGAPKRSFDSKPGGPSKRPFRREEGEGSLAPRPPRPDSGPGQRPAGKPGWKPKPSFGGKGKPGGSKSRPPFKSGPKSGGKRPGPFGKKRS